MKKIKLIPKSHFPQIDKKLFVFKNTQDLEDLHEFIGQDRAINAIQFGIHIQRTGYNIYALGTPGVGKRSVIGTVLQKAASLKNTPPDICYVHNFKESQKPIAIFLPTGQGQIFRQDMDALIEELAVSIPAIFESEEYRLETKKIAEEYTTQQEKMFKELEEDAKKENLTILSTAQGFIVSPTENGKPLTPEKYDQLSSGEKKSREELIKKFTDRLTEVLKQFPRIQRERKNREKELQKKMTTTNVENTINELKKKYADFPKILNYFAEVEKDIVVNVKDFLKTEEQPPYPYIGLENKPTFIRYRVNLLVNHPDIEGAPIIYEQNPNYNNLVGRIEHTAQYGALVTNFSLIRSGALHRANGGYLIIDMLRLLTEPFAWEALKRTLYSRAINIEPPSQLTSFISTVTLQPEPIPIDLKIILIGDRYIFYLLSEFDEDFNELFKVAAEFSDEIVFNSKNCILFSRLIATLTRRENLKPFDRNAVIRVLQQSSRWLGDSKRISIHMRSINDLLKEADFYAGKQQKSLVEEHDVDKAINSQIERMDYYRNKFYELIFRNKIIIDTTSKVVGQINALSIGQVNGFYFGLPARVSARVRVGKGEFLDIQREIDLSGPFHSKGVLILAGFMGGRYARDLTLALSASLVFEQTYAIVDGDSAAAAELCALLSALAEIPIKQSIAMTGAVDQFGNILAVGGISEKIEGFFDICRKQNLTGNQGVIIPSSNVDNLVLRDDVIKAIKEKKFHLYHVEHLDQALEILMSKPAGKRNKKGLFPKNSINYLVEETLKNFYKQTLGTKKLK